MLPERTLFDSGIFGIQPILVQGGTWGGPLDYRGATPWIKIVPYLLSINYIFFYVFLFFIIF